MQHKQTRENKVLFYILWVLINRLELPTKMMETVRINHSAEPTPQRQAECMEMGTTQPSEVSSDLTHCNLISIWTGFGVLILTHRKELFLPRVSIIHFEIITSSSTFSKTTRRLDTLPHPVWQNYTIIFKTAKKKKKFYMGRDLRKSPQFT